MFVSLFAAAGRGIDGGAEGHDREDPRVQCAAQAAVRHPRRDDDQAHGRAGDAAHAQGCRQRRHRQGIRRGHNSIGDAVDMMIVAGMYVCREPSALCGMSCVYEAVHCPAACLDSSGGKRVVACMIFFTTVVITQYLF